ncbi:peptidase [Aquirufa ecclesiirivi]|uniref:peptidase n=1 Tax=Aquirufa ecclesiirivi TaxID=2715124 RepID=UPI0022A85654|nr:peptidase [Aquirufa ecclesiirivi]MCZ2471249.1 peptidase [Aquirufa ecclesiirivi]
MTFCLGIKVKEGLVAIADTRITAGNEVYSNKKISIHEVQKHSLFIMTAGLRSVRDKAVTYFNQAIEKEEATYDFMFEAATAFGNMLKKVASEDRDSLEKEGYHFNLHALVGGQMSQDKEHKLFLIFPEGNWIEINEGLKYQIIGNSNYGKPLLNRNLTAETSLKDALKMGFLSFDATQVSSNDVDYPIDVVVYEKNSFHAKEIRLSKEDMQSISDDWNIALRNSLEGIDEKWMENLISFSPKPA